MSTQPIGSSNSGTSANQYATGTSLSSLGSGAPLQVTGLASGLDTNAIVQAVMAADQQQVTNLQDRQSGLAALNAQLTNIQAALQKVSADAKALGSPSLFAPTQTITSTNSTLVSATATGNAGAVVGSYQITVTQLASASQKSFLFTSQTAANTITIDGHDTQLAANASAQDFVNAINSDSNATVWATVTGTDPSTEKPVIVLSERTTGTPTNGNFVDVTNAALSEVQGSAVPGQDAQYTINGGQTQYSSSNTISGVPLGGTAPPTQGQGATQAIPGATLSLNGLTGSTPVTVNVGSPAPSTQTIQTAVQQFVTDYNSAMSQIQTQLAQKPSSSDPSQGTLFGDSSLQQLLANLRQQMDATLGGLTGAFTNMLDIGVSTGAASGSAAPSQDSINGNLTLDVDTLTSALTTNASAVKSDLLPDPGRQHPDQLSGQSDQQPEHGQRAEAESPRATVRADGGDTVGQPVDEQLAHEPDRLPAQVLVTRRRGDAAAG